MSSEFNIDRVYGNISKLMKDQEIKVSEMETIMGVSAGYFSKLVKNKTVLSSDVLYKVARRLGVTVDLLVSCDLTTDRATDNLRLMTRFLQKLRNDTDASVLRWKAETDDSLALDCILTTESKSIISNIQSDGNPLDGQPGYYGNNGGRNKIEFSGKIFYVDMNNTRIFVSHLVESVSEGSHAGEEITYYAVDACEPYKTHFVCDSMHSPELLAELELLYECLKRHAADLQISESVRGFIDAYVNPPKPTFIETIAALEKGLVGNQSNG